MALKGGYAVPEGFVGLPVLISTPTDVGRLINELASVDDGIRQAALSNGVAHTEPKVSKLLEDTFTLNKRSSKEAKDREAMAGFLAGIKKSAPVLHMSFSADPDVPFMEKLVSYLRREIHPAVLVRVGLQPNIGAGCIVRSTNKYFDLSIRKDFDTNKGKLLEKLQEVAGPISQMQPAGEVVPAAPVSPARAVAAPAQEVHA